MDYEKEFERLVEYWMKDILFYFAEHPKDTAVIASTFKEVFCKKIDGLEKEVWEEE